MLFSILQTVTWKIRSLIIAVLLLCITLFSVFIYYGVVAKELALLTQSKAQFQNFSVKEKVIDNISGYEFTVARSFLKKGEDFLSLVDSFPDLKESLVEAQALPKYSQLLDVLESKTKKFRVYIQKRSQSIEKQLIDLTKKIQIEKVSKNSQQNFYNLIDGRLNKITRIATNKKLSNKIKKEVSFYVKSFGSELELLSQIVAARKATKLSATKFEKNFNQFAGGIDKQINQKENYLTLVESATIVVMGFVLLGLIALLVLSFLNQKGIFKNMNNELEEWLLDYSRSLYERDIPSFPSASNDFHTSLGALISKYGQLQTVGELVESKLPFSTLVAGKDGAILWGNRAFQVQSNGLNVERISDLWSIEEKILFGEGQFEGICELKNDSKVKFEYFAVPLRNHDKYFIVFSPLERVEQSKKKMLEEHIAPLQSAVEGILSNNYHARKFEWKDCPANIQKLLEMITSVNSLIQTERQGSEKRLEILLKDLQKTESERKIQKESVEEVGKRLNSYREGIRGIKAFYVQMVEKQDLASQILVSSVEKHDQAVSLCHDIVDSEGFNIESAKNSAIKLQETLRNLMANSNDIGLSKVSLYLDDVLKSIDRLNQNQEGYKRSLTQFKDLMVDDYQGLSEELGEIDKNFIELIAALYEDVVHLNYRIEGSKPQARPSETV